MSMRGVGRHTNPTYDRQKAPSNYVPGLGRGAVGFTTRSDIGPAGTAPEAGGAAAVAAAQAIASKVQPVIPKVVVGPAVDYGEAPAGYVAGRGRGMGDLARAQSGAGPGAKGGPGEKETMDYSESNYDEFSGYGEKLFSDTPYDKEDEEADRIYEAIDERMDMRTKRRREENRLDEIKRQRQDRPKISDQFADLKGSLGALSQSQWEAIPDASESSLRRTKKERETFTPVPDSIIEGARAEGNLVTSLEAGGMQTPGFASVAPGYASVTPGGATTVSGLAGARGTVLGLKLDKMSDSVTGQTSIDPKGYLTDLNSLKINSAAEVGDIEKARLLLKSVTGTNPKHGPGWIAAARVEEFAGKTVAARKIIKQGCEACPESEDVWLEAARLQSQTNAKTILANAVRKLPTSVKIWLAAAELESENSSKKVVLRRALEFVPNSVKLWKTAIELEEVKDARIMLSRAVECVPHSVDMWLALARLETYGNARKVLNQAREAVPTEPSIWITAAKLEESQGHGEMVPTIIQKALQSLRAYQVVVNRDAWLKDAEECEKAESPITCQAIINEIVGLGVDEEDRRRVWLDDAESCLERGSIETGRALYAHAIKTFPGKKGVWMKAAQLEKKHGTRDSLEELLVRAVKYCPQADMLWLMNAKEKWNEGDVEGARRVLNEAFKANPDSEQVLLAAVKLEWENKEVARAQKLLERARERSDTPRVWMKSALLERELEHIKEALEMCDEGISRHPSFEKLYMMAGQYCTDMLKQIPEGDEAQKAEMVSRARLYYQAGLRHCPSSIPLWVLASALEESQGKGSKARSTLELARMRNPKSAELWLQAVRLEKREGNAKAAANLMAKALQECPAGGELWAEEIATAPKSQQKSKSVEALKRCDNNPLVITAVARLFQSDRKYAKARKWFNRSVTLDPSWGDTWAAFYAFELQHGTPTEQNDVMNRCIAAAPKYGAAWCSVVKRTDVRRGLPNIGEALKVVVATCFGADK
ncbi:unnamed protein product [Chrysoparadoxa australica]